MPEESGFKGDQKLPLVSPLAKGERRLIDYYIPKFPRWLQGYHLTMMTIPWSAGVILSGYLARENLQWLWLASAMLFMQWFSDSFDGSLGKYRDTGIPKWGYYMDHLLDYGFMSAIIIGYALLFDGSERDTFFILVPIAGAFMVNSYLSFAATSEFKITFLGMGPTEVRLLLIILNTAIIIFGLGFIETALPYVPYVAGAALVFVVYRTSSYIWSIDMEDKRRRLADE
jgi:phosphatidylglycerophosphate synthase